MTALPTLKMRVLPTFPSAVFGSGPIKVTKANGVWTFSFDITTFGSIAPPASAYSTDFLFGWDDVGGIFFKISLSDLNVGGRRAQRSATASPIVVTSSDQIINFNINAGAPTCVLPLSTLRNGVPLTFKDAGGHAAAHNLTITFSGGQTCDGLAQVVMNTNFGEVTLRPYNDLINTGWSLL